MTPFDPEEMQRKLQEAAMTAAYATWLMGGPLDEAVHASSREEVREHVERLAPETPRQYGALLSLVVRATLVEHARVVARLRHEARPWWRKLLRLQAKPATSLAVPRLDDCESPAEVAAARIIAAEVNGDQEMVQALVRPWIHADRVEGDSLDLIVAFVGMLRDAHLPDCPAVNAGDES